MAKAGPSLDVDRFKSDPCAFLENVIKDFVATSPINCLTDFDSAPMFDEPAVVFANGDDPIFESLKPVIGDFHLTPREALEKHLQSMDIMHGWATTVNPRKTFENVSVISYVLPIAHDTRLGEREAPYGGSRRHNHTRWRGDVFQRNLQFHLVSLLEIMGYDAVAPRRAPFFDWTNIPEGVRINWSERHIGYASGLGTFGLNGLLITSKGCAHYLGSVVCDVALTPTPRPYQDHTEYCLFYRDGSCGVCIERCKWDAISEDGHEVAKCQQSFRERGPLLKEAGLDKGLIGPGAGCGLCMTGVPCEDRIP